MVSLGATLGAVNDGRLGLSVTCNGGSALGCGRNTPTATRVMSSKPPEQDHASSLVMTASIQFESESYEIQTAEPSAQRGRIGQTPGIFGIGRRGLPVATFHKVAPQRLTASDEAVVGIGWGERRQERE